MCGKEHRDLWVADSGEEDTLFINEFGDVKIVLLQLQREYQLSKTHYLRIDSSSSDLLENNGTQSNMDLSEDSIVLNVTGEDPFVLLPPIVETGDKAVALEIKIESPVETEFQIYYRHQSDPTFNEKRSLTKWLNPGVNVLYFSIPVIESGTRHVRLDPGKEPGKYKLFSVEAKGI